MIQGCSRFQKHQSCLWRLFLPCQPPEDSCSPVFSVTPKPQPRGHTSQPRLSPSFHRWIPGAQRGYSARVCLGELGSEAAVILHARLTSLIGLTQPPRPPHRCTLCILTESIQGHICKVSQAEDILPGDSGPVVSFSGS